MSSEKTPSVEQNSPLRDAYALLNAHTPVELSNAYSAEDQRVWKSGEWDYKNPGLLINRVKTILEHIAPDELSSEEYEWVKEILWFWYHHATSCAIWKHADKEAAKMYSEKALGYQGNDHPNKITRLLYLLVHDAEKEAHEWAATIENDKVTAEEVLSDYRGVNFSS